LVCIKSLAAWIRDADGSELATQCKLRGPRGADSVRAAPTLAPVTDAIASSCGGVSHSLGKTAVSTGQMRTIRGPNPDRTPASATRTAFGTTRRSAAGIWTVLAAFSEELSGT